jgi:hypothetical protein
MPTVSRMSHAFDQWFALGSLRPILQKLRRFAGSDYLKPPRPTTTGGVSEVDEVSDICIVVNPSTYHSLQRNKRKITDVIYITD